MDAANNLALSTSVLACELIEISHCLAIDLFQALCLLLSFIIIIIIIIVVVVVVVVVVVCMPTSTKQQA